MLVKSSMNKTRPISHVSTSVRFFVVAYFCRQSAKALVAPVLVQMPIRQPNNATNKTYHAVSSSQATAYIRSIRPARNPVLYCRMQQTMAPMKRDDEVLRLLMAITRMTSGGSSVKIPSSI